MAEEQQILTESKKLNLVIYINLILGILLIAASFYYYSHEPKIVQGVMSGVVISLFNFWLLKRAMMGLLFDGGNKIKIAIQIVLKLFIMLGLVALIILKLKVSLAAFVIGFSTLVVALIIVGLSYIF